jgi:hypothetical protein
MRDTQHETARRTIPLAGVARSPLLFRDGRKDGPVAVTEPVIASRTQ